MPDALFVRTSIAPAAPLAQRIVAAALDPDGGAAGANVALRVLDAVDPLVSVEATTTVDSMIAKIQAGEDPTWSELRAVFGQDELAPPADALPPASA